jgi:hypothetical protein
MAKPCAKRKDNPMSCSGNTNATAGDALDALDDAVAAAAFRRLVPVSYTHLRAHETM